MLLPIQCIAHLYNKTKDNFIKEEQDMKTASRLVCIGLA